MRLQKHQGSPGLHQNPAQSTIEDPNGATSRQSTSQSRFNCAIAMQSCLNSIVSDHNRHNQIELQRDFKTTKDRQGIQRIAPKIHKLQADIPNCPRIGLISRSVEDQSAIHPKSVQCCQILLQSRGLWWDCRFEAIPWQSCFNPQQSNFPSHGTGQP